MSAPPSQQRPLTPLGMDVVAAMVPRLLALPGRRRLDDELDAIAVGITCLASIR